MRIKHDIDHLISAMGYSLAGIQTALKETAFQQELFFGFVHYLLIYFLDITFPVKLILVILWPMIMCAELINSAIEQVVDHISPEWNEFAKRAKDMGSAAVGILVLATISVWGMVIIRMYFP